MTAARPVILTLCDYYLPGDRAGGPITTLAGIVEHLQDEFEFKLVTRDRDLGEGAAYEVPVSSWQMVGAAQVLYVPPRSLTMPSLRRLIASTSHDALYVNSFFSVPFGITPLVLRRFGLIPRRRTIVAPRGEFAPGALAIHAGRKRLYAGAAKLLGLTRGVVWQASGDHEAEDIRRSIAREARVVIAPDLAPAQDSFPGGRVEKKAGHLRLLFVGRISRMKNLDGALRILQGASGSIALDICGPVEDAAYWRQCMDLILQLPTNVTVEYSGAVSRDRMGETLAQHDMMFLPTLGENFGHAILESMAAGCPVLISDRTRWRGLEAAGAGWDVALEQPERFRNILRTCGEMDSNAWSRLSESAKSYGQQRINDPEAIEQNRTLFRSS
jgi:glycosyltransferase involved in cell wall biosynthesis